jgi:hypothetical protein
LGVRHERGKRLSGAGKTQVSQIYNPVGTALELRQSQVAGLSGDRQETTSILIGNSDVAEPHWAGSEDGDEQVIPPIVSLTAEDEYHVALSNCGSLGRWWEDFGPG